MQGTPWRSIVVLVLILISFVFNLGWLWALVLLIWAIPDIFTGVTYLVEPVERKAFPVLYWSIIVSWIAFSGYLFVVDLFPELLPPGWA